MTYLILINAHSFTHASTHIYSYSQTYTHTHFHTFTHSHPYPHTHTHACSRTHLHRQAKIDNTFHLFHRQQSSLYSRFSFEKFCLTKFKIFSQGPMARPCKLDYKNVFEFDKAITYRSLLQSSVWLRPFLNSNVIYCYHRNCWGGVIYVVTFLRSTIRFLYLFIVSYYVNYYVDS